MRYLLYYPDSQELSFGHTAWWVNKFCGWFGVYPVPITDLAEQVQDERFHGHAWVWLDPNAEWTVSQSVTMNAILDDRAVPFDDVVFVVGHDEHGFGGYEGEGMRVKLTTMHPDGVDEEYHAAICATLLLCRLYL